ncbi:MAG TPA: hypothetical protein VFI13_05635, partial [Gemmatimonadales bacterium]|nr:hypothetical protein [Gemmatimonadales bacterium]
MGALLAAVAAPGAAQLPRIGVPRGQLRVEIGSQFDAVNAELAGGAHPLHDAWNGDLGPGLDGNLSASESLIQTITGDAGYRLSAGRSRVTAANTTGTAFVSAGLGLTDRLSLFGTLPFVRARWQVSLHLDSASANVGFNPNDPVFGSGAGIGATSTFFTQFQAALTTLQGKIANGDYDGSPATKTLAQQTLAAGTALAGELGTLYGGPTAPFVPLAGSPEGVAIQGLVDSLQSTLSGSLSVPGFSADPVFATARLTDDDLRNYLTNTTGPVQSLLRGDQYIQRQGDVELGANYVVLERPGFRLAATGLVRLPTGLIDRSDNFFDLGTGDGQTDLEGRLAADLTRGRFGARLTGGYNRQLARTLERRVGTSPVLWRFTAANVSVDPGDVTTLGIEPFVRLAPGFALALGAFRVSRGADRWTFASSGAVAPGAAAQVTTTALQAGLTYSSFAGITGRGT